MQFNLLIDICQSATPFHKYDFIDHWEYWKPKRSAGLEMNRTSYNLRERTFQLLYAVHGGFVGYPSPTAAFSIRRAPNVRFLWFMTLMVFEKKLATEQWN